MNHREKEISPRPKGGQKRSRTRSARSRQSAWTRSLRSTCSTRAPRTERRGERSRRRGGTSSAGACTCICARRRTTRPQRGRQPDGWPSTRARVPRSECQGPASGGPSRSRPRRRAHSVCPRRRQRDRRRRAATRNARDGRSRRRLPPRVRVTRVTARRPRDHPSRPAGHLRCTAAKRRRCRRPWRRSHPGSSGDSSCCSRGASARTAYGTRYNA